MSESDKKISRMLELALSSGRRPRQVNGDAVVLVLYQMITSQSTLGLAIEALRNTLADMDPPPTEGLRLIDQYLEEFVNDHAELRAVMDKLEESLH